MNKKQEEHNGKKETHESPEVRHEEILQVARQKRRKGSTSQEIEPALSVVQTSRDNIYEMGKKERGGYVPVWGRKIVSDKLIAFMRSLEWNQSQTA